MTQTEVETLVLDVLRRYAPNGEVSPESRIDKDLRLAELARQRAFASLVEAFNARGTNLPSRGYYLSNFNACPSVADVQSAVCNAMFSKAAPKSKGGGHTHGRAHTPAPAPAPAPAKSETTERVTEPPAPQVAPAIAATAEPTPAAAPDAEKAATKSKTKKRTASKKKSASKKRTTRRGSSRRPARKTGSKKTIAATASEESAGAAAAPAGTPVEAVNTPAPQDSAPAGPAAAA